MSDPTDELHRVAKALLSLPEGIDTVIDPAGAAAPHHAEEEAPTTVGGKTYRGLAAGQVDRIVMSALPEGMHMSRDARIAFQKAATITMLYLACIADDERTQKLKGKKRSTLSVQDMRDALVAAGMGHLLPMMHWGSKRARS